MSAKDMAEIALKALYAICVAATAIHFDKAGILWWYLPLGVIDIAC